MQEKKHAHVRVAGRVQGVGFRWSTQNKAQELGLTGWVRNRRDGGVEAVFEGPAEAVESAVNWCHRGPRSARVTNVDISYKEPTDKFSSFRITW